jgi:hypothetical protein
MYRLRARMISMRISLGFFATQGNSLWLPLSMLFHTLRVETQRSYSASMCAGGTSSSSRPERKSTGMARGRRPIDVPVGQYSPGSAGAGAEQEREAPSKSEEPNRAKERRAVANGLSAGACLCIQRRRPPPPFSFSSPAARQSSPLPLPFSFACPAPRATQRF